MADPKTEEQPGKARYQHIKTRQAIRTAYFNVWLDGHSQKSDLVRALRPKHLKTIFISGMKFAMAGGTSDIIDNSGRVWASRLAFNGGFNAGQNEIKRRERERGVQEAAMIHVPFKPFVMT